MHPAPMSPSSLVEPPPHDDSSPPDHLPGSNSSAKLLKLLSNQRDYQRRKSEQAQQEVNSAKDELNAANDHISFLEYSNTHAIILAVKLREEAEKSANLLVLRTERFAVFRD